MESKSLGRDDIPVPTTGGQLTSGFVTTSNNTTTYQPMYKAYSRRFYRDCLVVEYIVATDTSPALTRLHLPAFNLSTSSLLVPTGTQGLATFKWEHGQEVSEVAGEPMELEIQVRLSSGSDAVIVFNPQMVTFAASTVIDGSATNGNPGLV